MSFFFPNGLTNNTKLHIQSNMPTPIVFRFTSSVYAWLCRDGLSQAKCNMTNVSAISRFSRDVRAALYPQKLLLPSQRQTQG